MRLPMMFAHILDIEDRIPRRLLVDRRKRAVVESQRPRHIVAVRLTGGALKAYEGAL
jgi:hypothetical protein